MVTARVCPDAHRKRNSEAVRQIQRVVRVRTNEDDGGRQAVTIRVARVFCPVMLSQTGKDHWCDDKEQHESQEGLQTLADFEPG